MKKLLLIIFFPILLLTTGCEKEDTCWICEQHTFLLVNGVKTEISYKILPMRCENDGYTKDMLEWESDTQWQVCSEIFN